MSDRTCDRCGSSDRVTTFYGKERCDKGDPWLACWDCRYPYIRDRLYGDEAADNTVEAIGNDPMAW